MKMTDAVNKALKDMHREKGVDKGKYGELSIEAICEKFYQTSGGILYHSYIQKTVEGKAGNIKKDEQGNLYRENLGNKSEIDVLLVTPRRIFVIEVKAYKSDNIVLTDDGISGCLVTNKSPVHQNEFHCRHLYRVLAPALPNGDKKYIVPIVCFVDKCKVKDKRSIWQKNYIYVTNLNGFESTIKLLDTFDEYLLDLPAIDNRLLEARLNYEKYLPLRV